MTTPPPEDFPGLDAEERDRRRIADTSVPIAERAELACAWDDLWTWAIDFAATIENPQHRSNALRRYAEHQQWWADAIGYLIPEAEAEAAECDQ